MIKQRSVNELIDCAVKVNPIAPLIWTNILLNHFLLKSAGTEISVRGRGQQEGAPIREIDGYLQTKSAYREAKKHLQENHARECWEELQEVTGGMSTGRTTLTNIRSSPDTAEKLSAGLEEMAEHNQTQVSKIRGRVQPWQEKQLRSHSDMIHYGTLLNNSLF